MAVWAPGTKPYEDLPTLVGGESRATLEGSTLRAAFELVTPDEGRATGSASLGVELTPSGPPISFPDEGRDGNRLFRLDATTQLLAVDGTLTLDLTDGTHDEIDLASCGASTDSMTFFATNPNGWVYGGEQLFISCEWSTERGVVSLFAIGDGFYDLSQLVVVAGDRVMLGMADQMLSETTYEAHLDLFDLSSGEAVGSGTAAADLAPSGSRIVDHEWVGQHHLSTVGERLAIDGTLDLSVDGNATLLAMDDATCVAGDVRVQTVEKIPQG
jgi:hypothetical protein